MELGFSYQILEKMLTYQVSRKSIPLGAKFFHADGRTDMAKLTIAFRNFANAPNNRPSTGLVIANMRSEAESMRGWRVWGGGVGGGEMLRLLSDTE
jgi:hypothetical protein